MLVLSLWRTALFQPAPEDGADLSEPAWMEVIANHPALILNSLNCSKITP